MKPKHVLSFLLALLLAVPAATTAMAKERPVTVFAAASLTDVLGGIAAAWAERGEPAPKLSFASSATLARQVEAGARADVFISADQEWMDYLALRGLIRAETRRDIVVNRLVLVAPASSTIELRIAPGFPLAAALGRGRLAMGDPDFVPAGRYAQSALVTLGVWSEVADRLVRAENVRVALAYVSRGEAPLGIVYATDARADQGVRVVGVFPGDTHPPITYPAAATREASAAGIAFVTYLASRDAREIFRRAGFEPLGPVTP